MEVRALTTTPHFTSHTPKLNRKRSLTHGAASGIGRACCLAFAKDGARGLVVADINLEGAKETAAQAKAAAKNPDFRVYAIAVDVSIEDSVRAAVSHAAIYLGRIDYAVHSAGVSHLMESDGFCLCLTIIQIPGGTFDPIAETSFADFKHLLDVNVNGTFLFTSLVSAAMKIQEPQQASITDPTRGTTHGSIVILSSVSQFMAVSNMTWVSTFLA